MKRIFLLFMLVVHTQHALAWTWRDWWATRDQQGKILMENGAFSDAAKTFERKDWQAAAAYRAKDYKKAIKLYSNEKTSDAFYNQGNALAQLGQLKQAIKAYDDALAIDASHTDAIYNRNLLKELLKQQQNKQDNKQDDQKNDQQDKDQNQQDNQQGSSSDQSSSHEKDGKNGDGQQNQPSPPPEQEPNNPEQDHEKPGKDSDQKAESAEKQDEEKKDDAKPIQQQPDKERQQQGEVKEQQSEVGDKYASDQERAKQQWLRLVPDDPGGLLREKFLRDYWHRHSRVYP